MSGSRVKLGPMLVNSIAHPIVSLITGGYFPGLLTAPIQLLSVSCLSGV